jgi:hypothetical protein
VCPTNGLLQKLLPYLKVKVTKNIGKYRPIANLCAVSKIFKKLILKRILEIQDANGDLTGENQHGLKNPCTSTLSAKLQSMISRALDGKEHVSLASLDLSSAFDLVNINLLMKRLKIIEIQNDITDLVSVWLRNRSFYVSIDGIKSIQYDLPLGTVQGSILGYILYAIFV